MLPKPCGGGGSCASDNGDGDGNNSGLGKEIDLRALREEGVVLVIDRRVAERRGVWGGGELFYTMKVCHVEVI